MQCIFCSQKANSKEHLWGAWLQKVYSVSYDTAVSRHLEDRNAEYGGVVVSNGQFKGGEHPFFKTSKVVCTDCNNNWMSQIENKVAKLFPKIFINGETQIGRQEFSVLKRWCFLKFCVFEAATEHALPPVISQLGLEHEAVAQACAARLKRNCNFHLERDVPSDYFVYVGRVSEVLQDSASHCIDSSQLSISQTRILKFDERKTFIGNVGHMHFLVTNHSKLIGYIHSTYFSRKDRITPLTNPKFNVTEIPLAALNSRDLEEGVCSFIEKLEERKLRRNFKAFKEQVQNVRPRRMKS